MLQSGCSSCMLQPIVDIYSPSSLSFHGGKFHFQGVFHKCGTVSRRHIFKTCKSKTRIFAATKKAGSTLEDTKGMSDQHDIEGQWPVLSLKGVLLCHDNQVTISIQHQLKKVLTHLLGVRNKMIGKILACGF